VKRKWLIKRKHLSSNKRLSMKWKKM
jgi:hypothetical protein